MGFLGMAQVGVGTEASLEVLGGQPLSLSTRVGSWWSGVEHLGALLLVNAKAKWDPCQPRIAAEGIRAQGSRGGGTNPNQQSLAADPPTQQPLDGEEEGAVSEPGRIGKGLQCAGLGQSRRQEGA